MSGYYFFSRSKFCTSSSLYEYNHVRPTVRRAAAADSPACVLIWLPIQFESGKTKLSYCISRRHRREALERGCWLAPSPNRITPSKYSRYPSYRGVGGPRAGLDGSGKILPRLGFNPGTSSSQPVTKTFRTPPSSVENINSN